MYSKLLAPLLIVEILRGRTSEDSPMCQSDIQKELERTYGLSLSRNTISSHIATLLEHYPDNLGFRERVRVQSDGAKQTTITGLFWIHDFSEAEIRFLGDGAMSAPLPQTQKRELLDKLASLNPQSGVSTLKNVVSADARKERTVVNRLLINIGTLDQAIAQKKRIRFLWGRCAPEGKTLVLKPTNHMSEVDPRQIITSGGHYYLLATYPSNAEKIFHFRIDVLFDIELTDVRMSTPATKQELTDYQQKHFMMFRGGSNATIRVRNTDPALLRVFDAFGVHAHVIACNREFVDLRVKANLNAMRYWIKQNSDSIDALAPQELRCQLAKDAQTMLAQYTRNNP